MKKALFVALLMMVFAVLTADAVEINGFTYVTSDNPYGAGYTYVGDQLGEAFKDIEEGFNCTIDWLECVFISDEMVKKQSDDVPALNSLMFSGIQRETRDKVNVVLSVSKDGTLSLIVGVND